MDFAFISIVVVLLVILLVDNRFQEEQVVTLPVQERDLDSERFMPKSLHRLGNYKDYTMDDSKWEMAVARPIGKRLDGKSENNDGKRMIVRPPPFDRNANAIIYPNRAYCYKIKLVEKQKKLFINICTHKLIPKFKPLSDFDLEKMVLNRSNLNLMICYSGVRQEKDKTGEDCFVLDVVISPTLLYEIWKKKNLKFALP